ncbi:MAG: SAF domain-containing protein [Candidatus Obscuribacter sp.]|nr:hypothetical protein [Candidatus Melainabacteria bacterium]MDX1989541.1 SAF domain-containing protein [Candidatus Obscuribacter sp.]
MKHKTLAAVLALACILAFCARVKAEDSKNDKGVVVYFKRDLKANVEIGAGDVEEKFIPIDKISADAITSASLAVGRCTAADMKAGQMVFTEDLKAQKSLALILKLSREEIAELRRLAESKELTLSELIDETLRAKINRSKKSHK